MDEARRYLDQIKQFVADFIEGMTQVQIRILAGMAVFLVLFMCVGGSVISSVAGGKAGGAAQAQPATIMPTVTTIVTQPPTATPTIAVTAVPYDQLIPADWLQFKTPLVEIWMPKNFKLADKKTVNITAGYATPELLISEVPSKSSAYNMLVGVSWDVLIGDSLDAFLETKSPNMPYQARITDHRTVYVNAVEARRIVIEFRINNVDYNEMVYVFLDGSTVWYVEYAAQISEFFDNLPIFEQSIKTFRPVKY